MDIRSYFGSSSKPSTSHKPVLVRPDSSSSSSDDEEGAVPPTKKPRISVHVNLLRSIAQQVAASRSTKKSGKRLHVATI